MTTKNYQLQAAFRALEIDTQVPKTAELHVYFIIEDHTYRLTRLSEEDHKGALAASAAGKDYHPVGLK